MNRALKLLETSGRMARFMARVTHAALHQQGPRDLLLRSTLDQAWIVGVKSLPLLVIISAFIGTNLALQGYSAFRELGGDRLLGLFVAQAGVRELAPLMVAAMVAAKAGTEMASQLAVMRIREQIDALEVMAINPFAQLVLPRFAGIVLVLPPLTILSVATLMVASWFAAVFQLGLESHIFLTLLFETLTGFDLLVCGVKSAVFGALICTTSTFFGFHSPPGPSGVGRSTNLAVVVSAVTCAIANYVISAGAYG
ncbi:MAG: MlaE family ABC transporter permease [Myxococcota bacterium]